MRRLARTLLAGGVVYPAGTREDDIAVEVTRDDVWEDRGEDDLDTDHPVTAELRQVAEYLAEQHLADRDVPVSELLARAVEIFGVPAVATTSEGELGGDDASGDQPPAHPPADPAADRYDGWRIDKLRNEAAARDIQIEDPSDKAGILAALRAADAAAETGD